MKHSPIPDKLWSREGLGFATLPDDLDRLFKASPAWHDALRTIVGEVNFSEDDGAMQLGKRLLAIDKLARDALALLED